VPRDGGGDVRLFDWDSRRVPFATTGLAYMMAIHWCPDRRRRMERALLDCDYATPLAHGAREYDRHSLYDDYRLAVLWQLATPVLQAAYDIPPGIGWNNLERALPPVDVLGWRDLLCR
jgi:hypothetical protein